MSAQVSTFLVLYRGPEPPVDASHEGWPEWFAALGDGLVDRGARLGPSLDVGEGEANGVPVNGYSLLVAADLDAARALVADHPFLEGGDVGRSVQVLQVAAP
jgi:hypothetical protein